MSDQEQDNKQDPQEVEQLLRRLSCDKRAFGAHLGMRVDRDYTLLERHEQAKLAAAESAKKQP